MQPLAIGPVQLENAVILAPMSGISDAPFRRLAERFGSGLTVSEMVASDRLVAREAESELKLDRGDAKVFAVQLAGCRAEDMAHAAKIAEAGGADIIDINMGCPAKTVVGGEAGSALMRDVRHAASLIAATVAAVSVPVTVKMRLGFSADMRNAPELAARARDEGARLITVHGRTRCQRYLGHADWRAIADTVAAVDIPVLANGDCGSADDARQMLAASGAAGVMVGRAAVGAPWLPGQIAASLAGRTFDEPSAADVADIALEHFDRAVAHYGAPLGVRLMRKHTKAYGLHAAAPATLLRAALTAADPAAARAALLAAFASAGASQQFAA
ncbi:MAG: tRNA dihydrouridine synthase DusB [Pseudomonadota bacterium]